MTALLLTMAMTASLVGCGSSDSNSSDAPASSAASSEAGTQSAGTENSESHDPVTLRFMWWGGDERAQATLDVIDKFEQEYPWITVEAEYGSSDGYQEKLTAQLVSGTVADIFQMGTGWMPGYVESNPDYFVDFNDFSGTFDLSTFEESILKITDSSTDISTAYRPVLPDTRCSTIRFLQMRSDWISQMPTLGMTS